MTIIKWSFFEKEQDVIMLGDRVAYSWTCGLEHEHVIECLWVWHDCDRILDPVVPQWSDRYTGWKPSGVAAHDLISADPLHIEASVYWPSCCGMHGWIREGKWVDA